MSRLPLYVSLGALMVVAIIELSFISATVGWFHSTASNTFTFEYRGSREELKGEPKNFITDQGHTSNGAAGTAFVLIGLGGCIILWLRSKPNPNKFSLGLYRAWIVTNVLSLLLTLSALIYVFVVTDQYSGQTIDPRLAASLQGRHYNIGSWTPQSWFPAILQLDLVDDDVRSDIASHVRIMRGWQYNLIPFFLVHLGETGLALWDARKRWAAPLQRGNYQKASV
ncbi:hypothetical protein FZEAL_10303 [Fusarium zealandicum]|uniref:Uncharacterized protein n=1 Tax=Fusarium zealandicum TaxID=1053134 RepID=A0A8H4U404_9HYPO|nr:hypothetical protein FZEAL_10303 [Fusarium zealandicum]